MQLAGFYVNKLVCKSKPLTFVQICLKVHFPSLLKFNFFLLLLDRRIVWLGEDVGIPALQQSRTH